MGLREMASLLLVAIKTFPSLSTMNPCSDLDFGNNDVNRDCQAHRGEHEGQDHRAGAGQLAHVGHRRDREAEDEQRTFAWPIRCTQKRHSFHREGT